MKPGDKIIVFNGFDKTIEVVSRVLKTQVVLENGARYNLNSKRLVGRSAWCRLRINEPSEEELAKVEKEILKTKLVKHLKSYDWNQVDTDLLWEVVQLMKGKD